MDGDNEVMGATETEEETDRDGGWRGVIPSGGEVHGMRRR